MVARGCRIIDEIDLVRLVADHGAADQLCAALEGCADRLPDRPDSAAADTLCDGLTQVLHHIRREGAQLATMFARDLTDPLRRALIDQIAKRHIIYGDHARELIAVLRSEVAYRGAICADAFGYMLRSFFEGYRQAMAFEELAILTLADQRLTPAARGMLTPRLTAGYG